VLGARRVDRLAEVAERCGPSARALPLDVADDGSVAAFCAAVDGCRVLVNNAGGALGLEALSRGAAGCLGGGGRSGGGGSGGSTSVTLVICGMIFDGRSILALITAASRTAWPAMMSSNALGWRRREAKALCGAYTGMTGLLRTRVRAMLQHYRNRRKPVYRLAAARSRASASTGTASPGAS